MTEQSLLAAVRAAAHEPAPNPGASTSPQEISMADPKSAPAPAPAVVTSIAELTSAFPDLVAQVQSDAAKIERDRVLGIAALADASNGALIAELQADGKSTPADAALRILGAQKEARGKQLQAIKDVETAVPHAPAAPAASQAPIAPSVANTPDGWKAEFAANETLRDEFASADAYVAYQQGIANGSIKVLSRKPAAA